MQNLLHLFPWQTPDHLLKSATMLLCTDTPAAGWENDPLARIALNGKLDMVTELSRRLHERKSQLQTRVNALRLAPHLQAPILSCVVAREAPLASLSVQQRKIESLARSQVSKYSIDALNTASLSIDEIVTELNQCEANMHVMLKKTLTVVCSPRLCLLQKQKLCLSTWSSPVQCACAWYHEASLNMQSTPPVVVA